MRVAIEARGLSIRGGASRYIRNLVEGLARLDDENEYWLIKAADDETGECLSPRVRSLVLPGCAKLTQIAWDQVKLPLTLKRLGCQLVHATKNVGPLNTRARLVVTVLDMIPLLLPRTMPVLDAVYWRNLVPAVLKRADAIIAISEVTKRDIVELTGTDERKIRVVPLGVEPAFRPIDALLLARFREQMKVKCPFLLYVGALEPRKNVPLLIRAFSDFKRLTHSPHKLLIVGKSGWYDPLIDAVLARSKFSDEIIFSGFASEKELPYYYNLAEAVVYPSKYEGFGMPVVEAMACGTPVITSDGGAIPEVVDGAGLIVPVNHWKPLTNAMIDVVSSASLRNELRIKGIERAKEFSWDKTASLTRQVYEDLVAS